MEILLTEGQYKKIITEQTEEKIIKTFEYGKKFLSDVIKDALMTYGINFKFLLTFGAGITSLMRPIMDFLEGQNPSLNPSEVSLLALSVVSMVFFETKSYRKNEILSKVKELNLEEELDVAIKKTESLKSKFAHLLNIMGIVVGKTGEMVGYTFILPLLTIINYMVNTTGGDYFDYDLLVNALVASGAITVSSSLLKSILDNISKRLNQ